MARSRKSLWIDALLTGPLMMWGGYKLLPTDKALGRVLVVTGVGTLLFSSYDLWKNGDQLPGGYASGKRPSDFDPKRLAKGTKVEMEHTTDPTIAREIAMDHLTEDPRYYDKLVKAGL